MDGVETQVYENEENVGEPEEDFEQSQSPVEPESIVSQATIGVFHQYESKILKYLEQFALISYSYLNKTETKDP